jgi:oxygen-dependent protoporphyrinogen oxidase
MTRVLVIGGGISGLVAARRLRASGLDVEVLEASAAPGGWLRTERVRTPLGELVVELGPDAILGEKPAARKLVEELGLGPRVVKTRTDRRGAYVVTRGKLERIPEGWSLLAPTSAGSLLRSPVLSPVSRVRALLEPLVPPSRTTGDQTLASFVRRRLGWESLERLAQPLASGIYGADAEGLGLAGTMPRFLEMERSHGSVRRGIAERMRSSAGESASGARYGLFFGFDGGMQVLVDALASELAGRVTTNAPVSAVSRRGARFAVSVGSAVQEADAIVIALPGPRAAPLLEALAPDAAAGLASIAHGSVATVTFAMRREDVRHSLDAYGFVTPATERRRILAATFASEKWPGRAPEGLVLIRAFVGAPDEETLRGRGDEALVRTASRELDQLLGLRGPPLLTRVVRHPSAMPRYALGHPDRARAIDTELAGQPDVALAGNALFGVGIPDAIASGERAAAKILARFSR